MTNCVSPWVEDQYGNCVYMPVDPGEVGDPSDVTYTGFGTGTFTDPGEGSALYDIETYLEGLGEGFWDLYGETWFDPYEGSDWAIKEELLRSGAGTDIWQLGETWGLSSGQLFADWGQATGDLYEDWYGTGEYIGEKTRLEDLIAGAGTTWGLMQGDITRRAVYAGESWGFTQIQLDLARQSAYDQWMIEKGGIEDTWGYKKEQLGLGTRGYLSKAMRAQETALSSVGFATAGTSAYERRLRDIHEGYTREIEEGERALEYGKSLGEFRLGQTYEGLGYDPSTGEWGGGEYQKGKMAYTAAMGGLDYEKSIGQDKYDEEIARLNHLISTGELTYEQAYDLAESQYNNAIAAGELRVSLSTTDIGQSLEQNIWGTQKGWRDDQRNQLWELIGSGILGETDIVTAFGCTDSNAENYNADATEDDGSCTYENGGFTCEEQGMITCEASGLCAETIQECLDTDNTDDLFETWINEDGQTCWKDDTGAEQCMDWGGGFDFDIGGFDLDLGLNLDQSECADREGTWNADTGKCEGVSWFDFNLEGEGMDTYMDGQCKATDPNSHWDGSKCVSDAGIYEPGQDYNQELTAGDCESMGGVGFSGEFSNACVTEESITDFSSCLDGGGSMSACASMLLAIGTTNPFVAIGATIADELGILDWVGENVFGIEQEFSQASTPCSWDDKQHGCVDYDFQGRHSGEWYRSCDCSNALWDVDKFEDITI